MLPRKTTINTKYCSFQYKILDNVLNLTIFFSKFGKIKFSLHLFGKSAEETNIYLVNFYVYNIYEIKLRSSFQAILPPLMSLSVTLGFTDTSIQHFLLINHLLLIYKCYLYKARDSQNNSFLAFKSNIIKIKTVEERTSKEKKILKEGVDY